MGDKFVKGHRWVTSGGHNACEACAAMHGREFYIDPDPGQPRYPDDIPGMPPLHPNCRCRLEPITDYSQLVAHSAEYAPPPPGWHNPHLHDEKRHYLGGYWKNDGRSITDGPANRNYCGQNWTAGRNPNNMEPHEEYTLRAEPDNDLDARCKDHDDCYDRAAASADPEAAMKQCDAILIREAERLPEDPRLWDKPPDNLDDGKQMRRMINIYLDYIK